MLEALSICCSSTPSWQGVRESASPLQTDARGYGVAACLPAVLLQRRADVQLELVNSHKIGEEDEQLLQAARRAGGLGDGGKRTLLPALRARAARLPQSAEGCTH